jgi:hypothetical protein
MNLNLLSARNLTGVLVIAALTLGNSVRAGYINGQLEFGDTNTPASTVTPGEVVPNNPATVTLATGDYLGLDGDSAMFNPILFSPATPGLLWTINSGGNTYTFTIDSFTAASQNAHFVNLMGTGTATATGYLPTNGTWTITDTNSSGADDYFTFGASDNVNNSVPDNGSTMLLIALGLLGTAIGVLALRKAPKAQVQGDALALGA